MASRSDDLFPDEVQQFRREWKPFRALLTPDEQAHWNLLVDRAENRSYPGQCQNASDPKWSIVFTILVTQQASLGRINVWLMDERPLLT